MNLRITCAGLLALALMAGPAAAQRAPLYQSGTSLPGDLGKFVTDGLLSSAGGVSGDALARGVNPFSVDDGSGLGLCFQSALPNAPHNALCLGHDGAGNGLITLDSTGQAAASLYFRINGALYQFPGSGSGNILGPGSSSIGTIPLWNNTAGTLLRDSSVAFPLPAAYGGTGRNTYGALHNEGVAVNATYTVTNADKGKTLVLDGAAFYPVALTSTADYDSNFQIQIDNTDGTRAKRITIAGGAEFPLWPNQSASCHNTSHGWQCSKPARWEKTAAQFYADPAGDDTSDCLAAGTEACATIGRALLHIKQDLDAQNAAPVINVACGTYHENIKSSGQLTGYNFWLLRGAAPGCVHLEPADGSPLLLIGDNDEMQVQNIDFHNLADFPSMFGIALHQTAVVDFLDGNSFSGSPYAYHFECDNHGILNVQSGYSISADAVYHVYMGPSCEYSQGSGTITLSGSPNIVVMYFGAAMAMFNFASGVIYSGAPAPGTQQWAMTGLSFASLSGITVPGTVPGVPTVSAVPWGGVVRP